jgi:hypothetical protein
MTYYGVKPQHTNPASPNENGDAEQSHHRFKRAVEQALLLRGVASLGTWPSTRSFSRTCSRSATRVGGRGWPKR